MKLRDLLYEFERVPLADADLTGSSLSDPAPGTGPAEATESPTDPAAEPSITEEGGQPPQTIPYSRFKEVNDRRRQLEETVQPYADLQELGYESEDLHRLVQWEIEFTQDPVGAWLSTAETIKDQLPEPVRAAIEAAKGGPQATSPAGTPVGEQEAPGQDEIPSWAKPILEDHEARKQREEREKAEREAAEAQQASAQLLNKMIEGWKKLDEKDSIKTRDETILTHIIAASRLADDPAEVLKIAREEWLSTRDELLQSEIKRPGGGPRPVPSGGSGGAAPAGQLPRAKTLAEASRRAVAAMGQGETPVR